MLPPGVLSVERASLQKPSRAARLAAEDAERKARKVERVKASAQRRRTSYGGSDWLAFKRSVLSRDGYRCVWCNHPSCGPLDVHHVRDRVQMGGRKKVSVNRLENAASLGRHCHALADEYRITPDQLEAILATRYGYAYGSAPRA